MKLHALFAVTASLLASQLVACGAPYTIIRQADPNPFMGEKCKLTVQDIDYQGMNVGNAPESAWLAKKGADEQHSYAADKVTMSQNFVRELSAMAAPFVTPGRTGYSLKPRLTYWEPGFYAYFASHNSEASMVLQIVDDKGGLLDEITLSTAVGASMANPSTGGRMHTAGKQLARQVNAYLRHRLGCY